MPAAAGKAKASVTGGRAQSPFSKHTSYCLRNCHLHLALLDLLLTAIMPRYSSRLLFYEQPESEDQPATRVDNLAMLAEAGLKYVDCFWKKCGFAIFGGYKLDKQEWHLLDS